MLSKEMKGRETCSGGEGHARSEFEKKKNKETFTVPTKRRGNVDRVE